MGLDIVLFLGLAVDLLGAHPELISPELKVQRAVNVFWCRTFVSAARVLRRVTLCWGSGGKSLVLLNACLETIQKRRGREQAVSQISYKIHIFNSVPDT